MLYAHSASSGAPIPYHAIPSFIAANMIMAASSGGVLAVCIAVWAQVCMCVCLCVCLLVSTVSMFVLVVWLDCISLWVMLVPVINPITDPAADRECECQWDCQWCLVSSGGYHCWLPLCGLLGSLPHWKYVSQAILYWGRASKPILNTVAVLLLIDYVCLI